MKKKWYILKKKGEGKKVVCVSEGCDPLDGHDSWVLATKLSFDSKKVAEFFMKNL
jgi:hypothetical protein